MKNICLQMNRKAWLALAMFVAMAFPALAQNITVTGTVYDQDDDTAIGASVTVQGVPGVGVATDIDGNFSIKAPSNGSLVVSLVGCKTQVVPINGRTHIDIHLESDASVLDELVVVGYGTVKKEDATGSVAVIKPDEIEAGLATSTQDLLVGASPGVVVTTDGGNPAGGATIRIRGGSSLNASNDPLIVIDGVPQTNQGQGSSLNAMTMINPSDIESMTILKDASATAIYGSRASNGVIIIQTKRGKSGKPQVNFGANFSVNTVRKKLNVMNASQFADIVNQYGSESTIAQLGYNGEMYNTDWQKEVLRTTFSQDYNLSVGGQVSVLPYRVNVSYTNNQGIVKTSAMQRVTAGLNLNPKFFNGLLQVNASVNGTYARQNNADGGAVGSALAFDPTKPVYNNIPMRGNTGMFLYNGYYNYAPGGTNDVNSAINPVQLLNDVNSYNDTWSSTGNIQIDYALHWLPELHFNLNLGYQFSKNDAQSITAANSLQAWRNTGLYGNNAYGAETLYKWHEIQQNTLLDFYINYKKDIDAIKSNLDVMVGYSWQHFNYWGKSNSYVNSLGFVNGAGQGGFDYANGDYYMDWSTHNAIGEVVNYAKDNRWAFPSQLVSFFGRLNYSLLDTYLLTFTLRDDASSRFAKENRWGLFPSVALGWKINNNFGLKDQNWLNEWKLRLGWGETGQQALGDSFLYLPIYTISNNIGYMYPAYNNAGYPGMGWINPLYPQAFNTNIKWETTTTWNVGMDLSVLNNRVTFSADWYLRKTRDLIAYVAVKGSNTSDMMTRNIGSLENYGLEFNVGAKPVVTKDFTWSTGLNVAWNRNKITSLNDGEKISARGIPGGGIGGDLQWFMEGEAAYTYRVYQQVYDASGNPIEGQYVDQNADGVIDQNDLINFHSPDPKVTLNWNNNFNYKNWDLGFVLRANIGNWVYNAPRRVRTNTSTIDAYGLNNLLQGEFLFHNTPTSQSALSDYWVENASFIRCDNITLGYTFSNLCHDKLRLRLFGAVQNPFVITKYKGVDPEVYSGCDNNVYPRPVTCTLGLVATF